jgi:hypothetical protein
MSYSTIVELIDLVTSEQVHEKKMALLEELRKLLNEEKEMLHANLRSFFPHAGPSDESRGDSSKEEADPHCLRKHAEELKTRAVDLIREADALMVRAEKVERTNQVNGLANGDKALGQAA